MEYNDEEKFQLEWMASHPLTDKDKEHALTLSFAYRPQKKVAKNKDKRNPSAWNLPLPEQELDLHGFPIDEAMAAIEEMFEAMKLANMTVLRLIHGGGHPSSSQIKRTIDKKVRSEWKGVVKFYTTEPNNAGASIIQLDKNYSLNKKGQK
jgi:DNA-nicking Smr family endonuclease